MRAISRSFPARARGSGEIYSGLLHLVLRDALRRKSTLDCILGPLLRGRLPLGLLSRRRRHIDVRQHLHAAVGLGDVPDHVVGDAALLRVLARVRRCQDTQGGRGASVAARTGKPCGSLCCLLQGKRAHPWARQQWRGRRVCQPAMGQPGRQEAARQACRCAHAHLSDLGLDGLVQLRVGSNLGLEIGGESGLRARTRPQSPHTVEPVHG